MSFNISYRFGFLLSTRDVAQEPSGSDGPAVSAAIRARVYPNWYDYIAVEWSIPVEWGDCRFNVYHSPTLEGNYHLVNPAPINGNSLIDYSAQEYSKFRNGYYKVEALLLEQGNARILGIPVTWHGTRHSWVEIRANEVQRRENILLKRFTGVKSYLFKKRMYGLRCKVCWDPLSETVTKDHCTSCFGTSFEGGYYPPIPVTLQYEPTPSSLLKTYFGKFEPNQIGAWTVSLPEVSQDDILIRTGDWNVYKIAQVQTTELQAQPVRQIMQLSQLSRRDVENRLVLKKLAEFPVDVLPPESL